MAIREDRPGTKDEQQRSPEPVTEDDLDESEDPRHGQRKPGSDREEEIGKPGRKRQDRNREVQHPREDEEEGHGNRRDRS